MRIIGPPPSVPGLADALALLTAMEAVGKHKDVLKDLQEYLKRAEDAKSDFDKSREEAEASGKDADSKVAEAAKRMNATLGAEAKLKAKSDAINADRAAFTAERNAQLKELNDWDERNRAVESGLKAREERLKTAEAAAKEAQAKADALIAEYTTKIEHLKKIAA